MADKYEIVEGKLYNPNEVLPVNCFTPLPGSTYYSHVLLASQIQPYGLMVLIEKPFSVIMLDNIPTPISLDKGKYFNIIGFEEGANIGGGSFGAVYKILGSGKATVY